MSELEKELREVLEQAHAEDLGVPLARYRREPEPLPDPPGWGPLSFLQPPTPWHLVGIGAVLFFVSRMLGRALLGQPLLLIAAALLIVGVLSLVLLPHGVQPKRWRGRIIELDDSWQARLYRQ